MAGGNSLVMTTRLNTLIERNSGEVYVKDKKGLLNYLFEYACSYIEFFEEEVSKEKSNLEKLVYERAEEMFGEAQSQSLYENRQVKLPIPKSSEARIDVLRKYDSQAYAKIMAEREKLEDEQKYWEGENQFDDEAYQDKRDYDEFYGESKFENFDDPSMWDDEFDEDDDDYDGWEEDGFSISGGDFGGYDASSTVEEIDYERYVNDYGDNSNDLSQVASAYRALDSVPIRHNRKELESYIFDSAIKSLKLANTKIDGATLEVAVNCTLNTLLKNLNKRKFRKNQEYFIDIDETSGELQLWGRRRNSSN